MLAVRNSVAVGGRPVGSADDRNDPGYNNEFETTLHGGTVLQVRIHELLDGGFVHTYTDVTEQRKTDARLRYLAHHDALTGLANRTALRQFITDVMRQQEASRKVTALMMVDLDGFKGVNDTLGHDAGDELLIEMGRRLRRLIRDTDIVARLDGDEFIILVPGLRDADDVLPLAQRVLRRLAEPLQMGDQPVCIGASIGIAFHPKDGQDADTLFKHADLALYSAKINGRGIYRCFDEQLVEALNERRLLEGELRHALDHDALEVHFQPKFGGTALGLVGFEALARWHHPRLGFISPQVFIHIAEECGLINRLGRWVLEQACRCVTSWPTRYPVAVNVSVPQLRDGRLKDDIAGVLTQCGLGPELLEIEVTESVLADDDQTVLENLRAIKAMGVRIALDDFGTGYSSLSYLRRFSFDKIKIDRSFVQGQMSDPGVRVILETMLTMSHRLGLSTVAEGIETHEQLALLRDQGCAEFQGYLLGRPMPPEAVGGFIMDQLLHPGNAGASGREPVLCE